VSSTRPEEYLEVFLSRNRLPPVVTGNFTTVWCYRRIRRYLTSNRFFDPFAIRTAVTERAKFGIGLARRAVVDDVDLETDPVAYWDSAKRTPVRADALVVVLVGGPEITGTTSWKKPKNRQT
jgi:hypothetical protein